MEEATSTLQHQAVLIPVDYSNATEIPWKNFRTWKKRDATTDSGSEIKFGAKIQKRIHSSKLKGNIQNFIK